MKAIVLVASARKRGNCYDFAQFMLERLAAADIETELINFYDYEITPCQNCNYECVQRFDPEKGVNVECPIKDDVKTIWKKTWKAESFLVLTSLWWVTTCFVGGLYPETTRNSCQAAKDLNSHFLGVL